MNDLQSGHVNFRRRSANCRTMTKEEVAWLDVTPFFVVIGQRLPNKRCDRPAGVKLPVQTDSQNLPAR